MTDGVADDEGEVPAAADAKGDLPTSRVGERGSSVGRDCESASAKRSAAQLKVSGPPSCNVPGPWRWWFTVASEKALGAAGSSSSMADLMSAEESVGRHLTKPAESRRDRRHCWEARGVGVGYVAAAQLSCGMWER